MRHLVVAGLGLSCVLAGVARCQEPRPDAPALLRRFDTDGDGKIDEKERRAVRELLRQRQSRPGATTGASPIRISPSFVCSNPARRLNKVDLPQPDGPTTARNSPSLTSREISSNAVT